MNRPTILATGAGKTGGTVVAQLREREWPVRAIVRRYAASHPAPPTPTLAIDDERWKSGHGRHFMQPMPRRVGTEAIR